jgi:hypothetical protein
MLYTALCGEILELKSCLAEPGPGFARAIKQMLYSAVCGDILELNSCLAEPGPGTRPAPQNKCFTLPSVVNPRTKLLPS